MKANQSVLAMVVSVFALVTLSASCGPAPLKCSVKNCATGCCDSLGTCQPGSVQNACGSAGLACQACGPGSGCSLGQCIASGNGGGTASTGGGTASTGGGTASTGGGTASTGGGTASTGGGTASTGGGTASTGGGTASTGGGTASTGGGTASTGGGTASTGGGTASTGGGTASTGGGTASTGGGTASTGGGTTAPANENCATAQTLASGITVNGSTAAATNDFAFIDTGLCQGSQSLAGATAGDVVYKINVPAANRLTVNLATSWDSTLNLIGSLAECGTPSAGGTVGVVCLAGRDDPNNSSVSYFNSTNAAVDIYALVDGFSGSGSGTFSITATVSPTATGDFCSSAEAISTGAAINGTLIGFSNDYSGGGSCGSPSSGNDRVYSFSVPSGQRATVTVTPAAGADGGALFPPSISLITTGAATCAANGIDGGTRICASAGTTTAGYTNNGNQPATVLAVVDSSSIGGTYTIGLTLGQPAAGDFCSNAPAAITATTTLTAQTLAGFDPNYGSQPGTACEASNGPDRIYPVTIPAGQQMTFTVTPASSGGFDPAINLFASISACDTTPRVCLAGVDDALSGVPETLTYTNSSGQPVTVYVSVASFSVASTNLTFDATISLAPPAAGETCANPIAITASGTRSGETLTGFGSNIAADENSASCDLLAYTGIDKVYSVAMTQGQRLTVTVTPTSAWDPGVYLIAGPAANCLSSGSACLVGADENGPGPGIGGAETITYDATAAQSVFIVVDRYESGVVGTYDLNVVLQ